MIGPEYWQKILQIYNITSWIKGRIRLLGIFTVAFLLFLAPAGGSNPGGQFSNPAGHSLALT